MHKSFFEGVLGMSCVENYTLGILKKHGFDISYLYCRSLIHWETLYTDVFVKNYKYECYTRIQRLQNLAKEMGWITLDSYRIGNNSSFPEILRHSKADSYFLLRVNPEFIENKFKTYLWRDDHYLFVFLVDGIFMYLNDTPVSSGGLSEKEIVAASGGEYINITIKDRINFNRREQSVEEYLKHYHEIMRVKRKNHNDYTKRINVIKSKHFLLIYRASLLRTIEFLSPYIDLSEFKTHIRAINKYIIKLEYQIQRKQMNLCTSIDSFYYVRRSSELLHKKLDKGFDEKTYFLKNNIKRRVLHWK